MLRRLLIVVTAMWPVVWWTIALNIRIILINKRNVACRKTGLELTVLGTVLYRGVLNKAEHTILTAYAWLICPPAAIARITIWASFTFIALVISWLELLYKVAYIVYDGFDTGHWLISTLFHDLKFVCCGMAERGTTYQALCRPKRVLLVVWTGEWLLPLIEDQLKSSHENKCHSGKDGNW